MTAEGTAGRGPGPKVPQRQLPECQVAHPRSPKPGSGSGVLSCSRFHGRVGDPGRSRDLTWSPGRRQSPPGQTDPFSLPLPHKGAFPRQPTGSRSSGQSLRVGLAFCLLGFFKFRTEHPVGCQTARETGGLGRTGLKEASPGNPKLRLTQRARRHSLTQRPSPYHSLQNQTSLTAESQVSPLV